MQIKLPNGIVLDDSEMWAESLQRYARDKGLSTIRAFVSTDTAGAKHYLLVDGEQPVYENTSFEACGVWLDGLALSKSFDN